MSSASAVPGFRLLLEGLLPLLLARKGFRRKSRFRHTIDTLHDLHAFAKKRQRQMLGRRSRIPVSCAGCLAFIRPLFARVDEATSAEWEPRFDLTSSF